MSSSTADVEDDFIFYAQQFLQSGASEVIWIPIDLALRKARENNDCDNMEYYNA